MAEETDNTRKQKAPLIKHSQGEQDASVSSANSANSNGKNQVEQGERRKVKVVVISKKPSSTPVKKIQPKIVINTGGNNRPAAAETKPSAPAPGKTGTSSGKGSYARSDARADDTGKKREHEKSQAGNVSPGVQSGSHISSFQMPQRPAAAAGRVGGKLVGHHGSSHQKPARPQSRSHKPEGGSHNRSGSHTHGQRPQSGVAGSNVRTGGFPPKPGHKPGGGGFQRPPAGGAGRSGGMSGAPASPIPEGKGPAKRKFATKKPVYNRKEKELEMEEKLLQTKKKITHVANPIPKSIDIMEVISVSELAKKMNLKASDLIAKLMTMGQMVTINQQIDADTATIIASEFGADVKIVSLYDETVIETASDDNAVLLPRPPVVTVMGHVDHGKTKLLDAIRKADVVSGEFGGITQHIGAYMVETPHGRITFLDTPGHEAFTRMRARGAQITDIVVLVVAADDGVMPQTIEAINHARDANVPIIVAVNKIDKPEANPDRVKSQLSDLGLMPEDWGGTNMFVELSALQKVGIDKLIESILLEAELLDLKANFQRNAEGKVLEAKVDHGRGIVATVMVERGTLAVGDSFVAGVWPGRVRAIFNDKGEKLTHATPSMPVEVLGFEGMPNAGDPLQVVADEKVAREYSSRRQEFKRFEDAKIMRKVTMDNLHDMISDGTIQELKVIIKADVQGSAEALKSSLEKLSTKEIRLHVIQALPGPVNEGDVDLAIASKAIIISFNVRPLPKAKILAEQEKVDIRKYNIIYKAVDEIRQAMEGMLKPDTKEEVVATVEVRDTFKVPKVGTIAGCYVLTGTVKRSCTVNVIRNQIVIHSGKIASLRRFKDDAREVAAGYECGIGLDSFDDIQIGDMLEVIETVEVARKLSVS
ncbi:MAG: translation initiation factor IF-2 [Treponema sp.]|nr:translation initiation factor IF-2 [Treponema sp.]